MTVERLREIRERLEHHCDNYQNFAGFSLSAPSDIRWLLDAVFSLQEEVNSLEEQLNDARQGKSNE